MVTSIDLLDRVRRRLALEPDSPTTAMVAAAVRAEHAVPLADTALFKLAGEVRSELTGAGPLEEILRDPEVTDVLVNGPSELWIDRGHGLERVEAHIGSDDDLRRLAQRLATACGRRIDDAQPWVDARLPDGTRFHALFPPIATQGVCLSLRTFRPRPYTLAELVETGTLGDEPAAHLRAIISARLAFLVTGGTGTGKTTMLGALLGLVDPHERIVVVEDAAELRPQHPHVVSLQARPANADGGGEVGLRDLVRQSLRMRPDRIVIGECRGAEVVDLLAALNTGHDGGAGTLHANSPTDVPARLEALAALGGLNRDALHSQLSAALRCIVHLRRTPDGRVVDQICLLRTAPDGHVSVEPAWRRDSAPVPMSGVLAELCASGGES